MSSFQELLSRSQSAPFLQFRLLFLAFLLVALLILPGFISGLLWGVYLALTAFLHFNVSVVDKVAVKKQENRVKEIVANKILADEDLSGERIYKGWINLLPERYNPRTYHINMTETVSARLQGHMLHIYHHEKAVRRYVFYEDPTITEEPPKVVSEDVYDLSDAQIKLRPNRLSARRWFSRKYPIMIKLTPNALHEKEKQAVVTLPLAGYQPQHTMNREPTVPLISDLPVDKADEAVEAPMYAEQRHTMADMSDIRKDVEIEEVGSKFEKDDELSSSASDDLVIAAPTGQLKGKFARTIWLFARSSREKELWFHKLRKASKQYLCPTEPTNNASGISMRVPSMDRILEQREFYQYLLQDVEFNNQISSVMNEAIIRSDTDKKNVMDMDLGKFVWSPPDDETNAKFIGIVNLLASRVLYDFARDEKLIGLIKERVQLKLGAVHLPCFIKDLKLEKFDLGTDIPKILKVYSPIIDQWGMWFDFEIKYEGKVQLTIATQVDLTKLTDENGSFEESSPKGTYFDVSVKNPALAVPKTRYSDEELPLSPEDEPDDGDFGTKIDDKNQEEESKKKPGRKLMQIVDKITHSDLFKGASELSIVRKALEEIADTRLMLNVEVTQLEGTFTLNIPPPPSDRLWYGFRKTPKFEIKTVPQVGDKEVDFSAISDWIEGKFMNIIENLIVFPNLDDFVIPLFSGNELLKGGPFTK